MGSLYEIGQERVKKDKLLSLSVYNFTEINFRLQYVLNNFPKFRADVL